jgi:hypothetical protein
MSAVQLLFWMIAIHLIGLIAVLVLIIPALRDGGSPDDHESGSSDDGWGNLPRGKPVPGGPSGGGIPLPDAEPAGLRLRSPARLGDLRRAHERRPATHPAPSRRPAPAQPARRRQSASLRPGGPTR